MRCGGGFKRISQPDTPIVNGKRAGGNAPGNGICQCYAERVVGEEGGCCVQEALAQENEGGQDDDHGGLGVSGTAQGGGQNLIRAVQDLRGGDGVKEGRAVETIE